MGGVRVILILTPPSHPATLKHYKYHRVRSKLTLFLMFSRKRRASSYGGPSAKRMRSSIRSAPPWTPAKAAAARGAIARGRRRAALRNARTGGFMGIETKFLDVYASSIALAAPTDCSGGEIQPEGGCTNCISCPAQGDGQSNRDGRAITMRSIFVSGRVDPTVLSDQADCTYVPTVFVALVQDTQTNGATIVSEQVFTNPNDIAATNGYPLRNLEYSSRYRVLDHATVSLAPAYSMTDGANTGSLMATGKTFTLSWNRPIPMKMASTTADVANVIDNSLHIIAFATSTGFSPKISYTSRMRFVG